MIDTVDLSGNWQRSDVAFNAGDEKLLVRFFIHPLVDHRASAVQGRPIYKDVEFIEIRIPDKIDRLNSPVRPASKRDKLRFRKQYQAFKDANADVTVGTPLRFWPFVTAAQVLELAHFNIRTVEHLAELPEATLPSTSGADDISKLRVRAKNYLETANGGSATNRLQSEVEEMRVQVESARRQMAEQAAIIRDLSERHVPTGPVELVSAHAPVPEAKKRFGKSIPE